MSKQQFKRRRKLILPAFQFRLIGKFVGLAVLALVLQFLMLGYLLMDAVRGLDEGSVELTREFPAIMLKTLAFSGLVLVPILIGFGVLFTFRIAGPVYRFGCYLKSLASGEELGPCRIRKGDELWWLCDVINEVAPLVGPPAGARSQPAEPVLSR